MPGERVLQATAVIDIQDNASAKFDAISKKFAAMTKALNTAAKGAAPFDRLEKSLAKIGTGADKVARSVTAMERGLGKVGSSARTAAEGASTAFSSIGRTATTAERAIQRVANAQRGLNEALSRASRIRPTLPTGGAPAPTRPGGRPARPGERRDRFGRLIEATTGIEVAENVATRAVTAGSKLEGERVAATTAGLTPGEAAEVEEIALAISRKYPTVPQTAVMRMARNARAATGDLEDALAVMDPLTRLRVLAQAKHPGADVSQEFETLVKGLEIKGVAQHQEQFVKYMNGMAKALNIFGEQVTPSQYYQMFKYGRGSTRGLSDDYMLSVAPTLAAELGGSSTGVAQQAFYQSIVGRRLKKSSMGELENLGLLHLDKVERDKKGRIEHIDIGGIVGSDLARADPYRWVNSILLPALAKKGVTDPQQVTDHIAAIFGNSLAQQLVSILATQQQRIEKDKTNIGKAQGLEAADEYLKRDPGQALGAFTSQLENLLANASSPMMPAATAALRSLADTLGALAQKAKEHPAVASGGLAAGIIGAGLGGLLAARRFLRFIGFTGPATAAVGGGTGVGAVAGAAGGGLVGWLGRRALGLGRVSGPALLTSAVIEALIAGYEAADDTGRTHPYGKPGDTADRLYRLTHPDNAKRERADRDQSTQRRAWFEERRRREREGLVDFMGPLVPQDLGEIAPGRRQATTAGPVGEIAATKAAPQADAVVGAVNDSLERAADKVTASLNGRAEISIKVDPSPEFSAMITRVVKEAMEAFNVTGPGSNGANGRGIDQHQ